MWKRDFSSSETGLQQPAEHTTKTPSCVGSSDKRRGVGRTVRTRVFGVGLSRPTFIFQSCFKASAPCRIPRYMLHCHKTSAIGVNLCFHAVGRLGPSSAADEFAMHDLHTHIEHETSAITRPAPTARSTHGLHSRRALAHAAYTPSPQFSDRNRNERHQKAANEEGCPHDEPNFTKMEGFNRRRRRRARASPLADAAAAIPAAPRALCRLIRARQ